MKMDPHVMWMSVMMFLATVCADHADATVYSSRGHFYQQLRGKNAKPSNVDLIININKAIHITSEKYLSVVMGPTTIRHHWSTFNLSSPRLHTLASALAPCILRVGGTGADFLLFNKSATSLSDSKEEVASFLADDTYAGHYYKTYTNFTMTAVEWDQLNKFVSDVGWDLLFDLNVLLRKGEDWDSSNAEQLLQYSMEQKYTHLNFELGNEPNAFKHAVNRSLSAKQLGRDFLTLHNILHKKPEFKEYFKDSLLVGPDVTKPKILQGNEDSPQYMADFLSVAGSELSAITWHQYYLDGRTATAEEFLDPGVLNLYLEEAKIIKSTIQKAGYENTQLWMGETGSCWGGGAPDLSDRYAGSFLYLDKLGLAATLGHDVILRQTFYEGSYGLIDKELYPNPDFWVALLYKRLVGQRVLSVTSSDRYIRVYAHCTQTGRSGYPRGAVTMYVLNLNPTSVTLKLSANLQSKPKDIYWLTPHGRNGLKAKLVNLNTKKLHLVDDTTLPELKPMMVPANATLTGVPHQSMGFIVIPEANAPACL